MPGIGESWKPRDVAARAARARKMGFKVSMGRQRKQGGRSVFDITVEHPKLGSTYTTVETWNNRAQAEAITRMVSRIRSSSKRRANPSRVTIRKSKSPRGGFIVKEGRIETWTPRDPRLKENPGKRARVRPDDIAARELELYATNDGDLYRQKFIPIAKNLIRKIKKGQYNHRMGWKAWMYMVDEAAKKYKREFGDTFDKPTREKAAKEISYSFMREQRLGNYNNATFN